MRRPRSAWLWLALAAGACVPRHQWSETHFADGGEGCLFLIVDSASRKSTAVFTSADAGRHWTRVEAPARTRRMARDGGRWLALTARELFASTDGGRQWRALRLPALPAPGGYYDVALDGQGRLVVCGGSGVWRASAEGSWEAIGAVPSSAGARELLVQLEAALEGSEILVLGNPFTLYRLRPEGGLEPLHGGLPRPDVNLAGTLHLARRREEMLVALPGNLWTRTGAAWSPFPAPPTSDAPPADISDRLGQELGRVPFEGWTLIRDILVPPWDESALLLATNTGIHELSREGALRTLWPAPHPNDYGLVRGLTRHGGAVLAGFHRAKEDAAGVRIEDAGRVVELLPLPSL